MLSSERPAGSWPAADLDGADDAARPDFDGWVAARGPALTRFATLLTGDRHTAEDVLQDALASAYARWDRVSRADDVDAYVRRMVVNAHVSAWRRFGRRERPAAEPYDAGQPDPTAAVGEQDAMWQACSRLPRRQRAAVVLRYYEGLSDAEVARVLGCGESTVRSQIHRALATLRAHLQEATDDA